VQRACDEPRRSTAHDTRPLTHISRGSLCTTFGIEPDFATLALSPSDVALPLCRLYGAVIHEIPQVCAAVRVLGRDKCSHTTSFGLGIAMYNPLSPELLLSGLNLLRANRDPATPRPEGAGTS